MDKTTLLIIKDTLKSLNSIDPSILELSGFHSQNSQKGGLVHSIAQACLCNSIFKNNLVSMTEPRFKFLDAEIKAKLSSRILIQWKDRAQSFLADIAAFTKKGKFKYIIEFESFNSSDERVVLKDFLHAKGISKADKKPENFIVITSLPKDGTGEGYKNYYGFPEKWSTNEIKEEKPLWEWLKNNFPEKTGKFDGNSSLRKIYFPFYKKMSKVYGMRSVSNFILINFFMRTKK